MMAYLVAFSTGWQVLADQNSTNEDYGNPGEAMVAFLWLLLGYEHEEHRFPETPLAKALLAAYLVLTVIVMLNLLIAMLTR